MGRISRVRHPRRALRVIVSGGTGFIGRALVTHLCERGDDVVVLSRGKDARRACLGPRPTCCRGAGKVELTTWTPEKAGDWSKIVDGADAVVHLAGAGVLDEGWTEERKQVLRSSRIRSTELLAEAIARADKKPRAFVSGSAIGYYGIDAGDRVLTEDSPPGTDFLARLVVDWENAAAAARELPGVRVSHPRIGLVLGRNGGMLEKMLPPFRAFVGGPVGTGAQYMGWIHLADTVRALEHAIDTDLTGAFNVTAPEPMTMEAFAHALGEAMSRPAVLRVPGFAVKLALGSRSEAVLNGQRAVPKRLVDSGFAFMFPELTSALADIVTTP
ncbi:MAG: Cell division inhibitor [Labilithrix sp.]|nr:Cell division inhibitor [Labilithrix sp.]